MKNHNIFSRNNNSRFFLRRLFYTCFCCWCFFFSLSLFSTHLLWMWLPRVERVVLLTSSTHENVLANAVAVHEHWINDDNSLLLLLLLILCGERCSLHLSRSQLEQNQVFHAGHSLDALQPKRRCEISFFFHHLLVVVAVVVVVFVSRMLVLVKGLFDDRRRWTSDRVFSVYCEMNFFFIFL